MQQHPLGRTGRDVSVIGLGTWQLGADWGDVSEDAALDVLAASADAGVTLFDTADVYGDGRSETLIGRFLAARPGHGITVATKMGRRLEQEPENYTPDNFRAWTDRSRRNLGVDTLDLVQLHCPPSAVIDADGTYDALDDLVAAGSIAAYGVSVETCTQALAAIARPGVTNVQIILNPFRLKPLDEVLPAAVDAGVSIFARVPLASGLLSGKYTASTTFAADDHRTYNRHGEAFDQGETFSGVEFETGLQAVAELSDALPDGVNLPAAALAWAATRPGVTTVIPGARNVAQAAANAAAAETAAGVDLSGFEAAVVEVYDRLLRESIHPRW
ncbi:aldo/keto reductase [Microbacterium invictum]|uniref:Aryl-alcohol dehydrogenase-like predicted oxidoreductase n=1 Tax=Microbacterium invictum TaxID=515415 RepID=A0AA40VMM2_9MICO|nr:aldo/keto reductase [Microbacterium invictum]MBB4139443.1 aryl-alcohol dehydrogenase-like predicted oxidoreductase [Microbacterium invictum]